MEVPQKRKRDVDCPRITYDAGTKVFDRLFKGDKQVKKKLMLLNCHMFRRIIGGVKECCAQETWPVFFASSTPLSTTRRKITSPGRWYSSHFIHLNVRG